MPIKRRRVARRRPVRRRVVRGRGAYTAARKRVVRRRAPARRAAAPRRAPARRAAGKAPSYLSTALDVGELASDFLPYSGFIKQGISAARGLVSGHGAYTLQTNSLMDAMTSTGPPIITNNGHEGGGVRVRHREYLGDVSSGSGTPTQFNNNTYTLNPGLSKTFPWLSSIAGNFEQYQFLGVIFEYKTLSVDVITGSTINLGAVIMATDYNVLHAPFPNKATMENYEFCNSSKPSQSMFHPVECSPSETPVSKLYVRTDLGSTQGLAGISDFRLYDLGNFQIASVGLPAQSASIGELWISYEVDFFKPQIPTSNAGSGNVLDGNAHAYNNSANPLWTGWTGAQPGFFGIGAESFTTNPGQPILDLSTGAGTFDDLWDLYPQGTALTNNNSLASGSVNYQVKPNRFKFSKTSNAGVIGSYDYLVVGGDPLYPRLYAVTLTYANSTPAAAQVPGGGMTFTGLASLFTGVPNVPGGFLSVPNGSASTSSLYWTFYLAVAPQTASQGTGSYGSVTFNRAFWTTPPTGTNPLIDIVISAIY